MERPKNFRFLLALFSVVAIALAAAFYAARHPSPVTLTRPDPKLGHASAMTSSISERTPPASTSSAAAQKRAKEFNDATNRFNDPDGQ